MTEVATKIIPVVSPLTIDTDLACRDTALQVLQLYLRFTMEVSKSPNFHEFLSQTSAASPSVGGRRAGESGLSSTSEMWQWTMKTMSSVRSRFLGESLELSSSDTVSGQEAVDSAIVSRDKGTPGDHENSAVPTKADCHQTATYGSTSPPDDFFADPHDSGGGPRSLPVHHNQPRQQRHEHEHGYGHEQDHRQTQTAQSSRESGRGSGWVDDDLFSFAAASSLDTSSAAIDNFLSSPDSSSSPSGSSAGDGLTTARSRDVTADFDPFADLDPFVPAKQAAKPPGSYEQASSVFNLSSVRYQGNSQR